MSPEKLTPEATAEIPSPEGAPLPTVEEYYGAYFQLSRVVCYPEELNQQEFTGFRNAMFYDANPQGPIEKMLLDRLASLIWRLRRAGGIESELLSIVRAVPSGAASPDDSAHEEKMSIMLRVASQTKPKEFNQLEWLQQYE